MPATRSSGPVDDGRRARRASKVKKLPQANPDTKAQPPRPCHKMPKSRLITDSDELFLSNRVGLAHPTLTQQTSKDK
ncbi:hypothetical protein H0H92_015936, partial [Tricholoma furcatifolium]